MRAIEKGRPATATGLATALLPICLGGLLHCSVSTEEPQNFQYWLNTPAGDSGSKAALLDTIASADREIVAVFNRLTDLEVAEAILERWSYDANVYIAADFHYRDDAGFEELESRTANSEAAIEVESSDSNLDSEPRIADNQTGLPPRDGRVESNILVADQQNCWISSGGATEETFGGGYSISFAFQSEEICLDLFNEARLMAEAPGDLQGLFSDEGGKITLHGDDGDFDNQAVAFGDFDHNKGIADPNRRFHLGDHTFYLHFAWQERPLNVLITRLLNARSSIRFAARSITANDINDMTDATMNRSHILDTFRYKARIPELFGGQFEIEGLFGSEVVEGEEGLQGRAVVGSFNADYYKDLYTGVSIHQEMENELGNLANVALYKNSGHFLFNLYLVDIETDRPQIYLLSSDLRRRYYEDGFEVRPGADLDERQPISAERDYFDITDAFMLTIEPSGYNSDRKIFEDFHNYIEKMQAEGEGL